MAGDHPAEVDRDPWWEEIAVLEHGLPQLPAELPEDELVPVARWVGPRFGAVVYVGADGASLTSEIYTFRRTGSGWQSTTAGGGGGWFDLPLVRPEVPSEFAALVHGHSAVGQYRSAVGWTGLAAATVEVEDGDGVTTRAIESPLGVFVVIAPDEGRAVVRVRGMDGRVLLERDLVAPSAGQEGSVCGGPVGL